MAETCRKEYPRPQHERREWTNLNGEWEFEFDDEGRGETENWHLGRPFGKRIQVPYCFQSKLSGIGDPSVHDTVWYRRHFALSPDQEGKRILLHFGAVDYRSKVWVNGILVVSHEGGHTSFSADITNAVHTGDNFIVVRAEDDAEDVRLTRGKQTWKSESWGIWYTRTTGIWQTVWLEAVSPVYLDKVRYDPDIDSNEIQIRTFLKGWRKNDNLRLRVKVAFQGRLVSDDAYSIQSAEETRRIGLNDFNDHGLGRWWTPEKPNLYDVEFTLYRDDGELDFVRSYFGMRKISVDNGKICLNNRPYFMKMVLDQGYFPEGVLTAPSDDALRQDVEMTKAMGFNGARKHQKVEDPRYLYWCDKLGLLVWGEMANAYDYSEEYVRRFTAEWIEAVSRDYNHPCIVAWVPINESWGVPNIAYDRRQQQHALAMYHLTKSLDPMRPVISNDGWEHVKSDICTIHDYEWRRDVLDARYGELEKAIEPNQANRLIHVSGFPYNGEPVHISEFGGIAFKKSDWEGWGYSGAENEHDFVERLVNVVHPMLESPIVQGFCYTQLTDVEQEINGLLTYDRKPKIPLETIKQINEGKVPKLDHDKHS